MVKVKMEYQVKMDEYESRGEGRSSVAVAYCSPASSLRSRRCCVCPDASPSSEIATEHSMLHTRLHS